MNEKDCSAFYHIILYASVDKPFIDDSIRAALYDYIEIKSNAMGCKMFKIGGTEDTVQFAISISPKHSLEEIVNCLKSSSVNYINKNFKKESILWEDNYAYKTFSVEDIPKICSIIETQLQSQPNALKD